MEYVKNLFQRIQAIDDRLIAYNSRRAERGVGKGENRPLHGETITGACSVRFVAGMAFRFHAVAARTAYQTNRSALFSMLA